MSIWHRWYTTTPINRLGSELLKGYTFTLSFLLLFYLLIKCFLLGKMCRKCFWTYKESLWETPTEILPTLIWFCYFGISKKASHCTGTSLGYFSDEKHHPLNLIKWFQEISFPFRILTQQGCLNLEHLRVSSQENLKIVWGSVKKRESFP